MTNPDRFSFSLATECWLALGLVIFTAVAVRLAELPLWQNEAFILDGGYLMATHDAYTWLAGVKMIGRHVHDAITVLLRGIVSLGFPVAAVGFWAPVVFVPLLAVPVCLLARFLRLPDGGLVFGILVTSGIGFLVRTRLGFCDTDVINLLFPVSMVCCLAAWIEMLKNESLSGDMVGGAGLRSLALALVAGICGKMALYFYPGSSSVLLPALGLSGILGFFLIRREFRFFLWVGLLLTFGTAFAGWFGFLFSVLTAAALVVFRAKFSSVFLMLILIAIGGFLAYLGNVDSIFQGLLQRLYMYAKVATPEMVNNATGMKLPDIAQSVREAQNLDWGQLGPRLGGNWFVFVLGILGFGFVSWRRPALLVFLPFLVLGLASVKLGNRFAMYGTVGIGMGLGLGLSEFMSMLGQSQGRRWIAQLVLACVVLWPSAVFMQEVRPVPVLPKIYAETFLELREKTEPEALLWQWWDYGYAGQYYAERATFGDGGRQSGKWLYPLAQVHSATSSRQASQLIRYFGQAMLEDGLARTTDLRTALFSGNPVSDIQKKDVAEAQEFLSDLVLDDTNWPTSLSNYFIVSWENLRLASWISYYGNWDIASGTSSPGKIQQVRGEVRMDSAAGTLVVGGKSTLLDSMDVVEDSGTRHFEWANGTGMHVVVNQMSRQVFLMDDKMYRSMMVQMLLRPASDFAEEFTLVVDNSPWARAYKVTN
ncbi:dolichyl-diphosphooligosaccharide--protein glycosyltransferase [Desulfomicrobium norvegicum]|uniref:Dolichyl-diphosphooligosaccharide--protein glycosyltransferase n=1 Tax=Desulfomicrobium norvegicum (strain DSM 1741 / NCIMB 8310) TaxID=52561 RepID=A0A8G2F789_DESNO|nr:STT3 domain-containing protein [Desulfomicrobium norvegicum]SFL46758.1 dolichyl-diphosphooligosaccharide--protein glycosyltransferase [Desulfomicrobium norvegicum]